MVFTINLDAEFMHNIVNLSWLICHSDIPHEESLIVAIDGFWTLLNEELEPILQRDWQQVFDGIEPHLL